MKKIILAVSITASTLLFAESPVIPELPTNPCMYVADAGCHIGPDGQAVIEPYDICESHGICGEPQNPIVYPVDTSIDAYDNFMIQQAKIENSIAAKYAKLEIYKECTENATDLKSLKVCKKSFKKKNKK